MSITYPLAIPTTPGYTSVRIAAMAAVAVSTSPFTFQEQAQKHQGQKWQVEIQLPPMVRADAEEWIGFLLSLNGREGTFLVGDPLGGTPRGIATGTPVIKGGSQTGNSLVTDGWTAGQTGILKRGDWINWGSGSTTALHKILTDANSDGSGDATFDIWPAIRTSPSDNDTITLTDCKGVFRLPSNEMAWTADNAHHYGLAVAGMEAF